MVHRLTAEQFKQFLISMSLPLPDTFCGGQYTTSELRKMAKRRNVDDWPKATDDPTVNHMVDCVVAEPGEEPEYDEQIYREEIAAAKSLGL